MKIFEVQLCFIEKCQVQEKVVVEDFVSCLNGVVVELSVCVGEGKIYGVVIYQDVVNSFDQFGFDVDCCKIDMFKIVKEVGEYDIVYCVYFEVIIFMKFVVYVVK